MSNQPNVAKVGKPTPTNGKTASARGDARGPGKTENTQRIFKKKVERTQGKRFTVALVADLKLHSAKQLRERFPNRDALMALKLAEALGCRYGIVAGQLMTSDGGAFTMTLAAETDDGTLTASVLVANSRVSDGTAWTVMLSNEMRSVVSQALEAAKP